MAEQNLNGYTIIKDEFDIEGDKGMVTKVIHPSNGYRLVQTEFYDWEQVGTSYIDENGKEVLHSVGRANTVEELMEQLDELPVFMKVLHEDARRRSEE